MKYQCPHCGAYLDPEERCGCLGPVVRRISGGKTEEIDRETFLVLLQSMRGKKNGKRTT